MRLLILLLGLLSVASVAAHEVRPAYLLLQQESEQQFNLLWRVPARGDMRFGVYIGLPEHCKDSSERIAWLEGGTHIERWSIDCPGGLFGHEIEILGLAATVIDALARVERLDGTTQVVRVVPSDPVFTVTESESLSEVIATYTMLGVEHILLGIDHLLFVFALLLLVPGRRMLIWTITSFTLAHSVTLAAATLGWVRVPQAPVEAVIALSILFVAMEIVHWKQGRPGITRRWPWLVAFTFGLLHGFGFASGLSTVGMPRAEVPLALAMFNVGVELGQLQVILLAFLAVGLWFGKRPDYRRLVVIPGSLLITLTGLYWTWDRIVI